MGGASKYVLIFLAFWRIFITLSHLFSCFNNFNNQFALFLSIPSPIISYLLILHYTNYSPPIFLKHPCPLHTFLALILLAKHRPFSPSPPILFALSKPYINPLAKINIKLKSQTTNLFLPCPLVLPYFINTSFYTCPFSARQPLISALRPIVTLHAVSQNKTARFVIQIKAKTITFL